MIRSLIATLLSGSFALQLLLAGVGSACVMPSDSGSHMAMASMPPMAPMAPMQSHGHGDSGSPCEQPGTPTACQVMATCAGGFVATVSREQRVAVVAPVVIESSIVTAPSSRTIPPELPPPRA